MNEPTYIYFDVGGVLLIDFSASNKWTEMKRHLGITAELDDAFESIWSIYGDRVCIDYDVDNMMTHIENELGIKLPSSSLLLEFVNRFELNSSIWPIAEKAKKHHPVGLLTNMYPRMLEEIEKAQLIPQLDWDTIVDSSIVLLQKPDDRIYAIAEERAQAKPSDILFIDNTQDNLDRAHERGWQTLYYDSANPIESNNRIVDYLNIQV